jgi:P-type conjugative transfer protein TrbJ
LNASVAPIVPRIVAGIQGQFEAGQYGSGDPAGQLDNRFPADMGSATSDQFQSNEKTWTEDVRQSLMENRRLQNQIYQDMDQMRQQVQNIVHASNAAPGETAAIQAHNDLMAVASAEFTKLQALKAARSRLRTDEWARQQSELSYTAAERGRMGGGWDSPVPPSVTVTDPFQQ